MKKIISLILIIYFATIPYAFSSEQQVELKKYVFDDSNSVATPISNPNTNQDDALRGYVGKIEAGSSFDVYLKTPINTATSSKGDIVTAVLTRDWVYQNKVIAQQGSIVTGSVTKAKRATYGYQNGAVNIKFNQLETVDGKIYQIKTEKITFKVDSTGKLSNAAGKVLKGAVIGLLGGLIAAAFGSGDTFGKVVGIGAGVGATTGLITVAAEKGVDAEIPAFTEIVLVLEKPLNITFTY
ncbi:MAG: hypothetical protein E7Z91_04045 [Cyanobacteria bacterium SIG30]|nr:hypothetical protein [Cyanobacteria bacterium SIG30]